MKQVITTASGKRLRIKSARKIQAEDRAFWAATKAPRLTDEAAAVVRAAIATHEAWKAEEGK